MLRSTPRRAHRAKPLLVCCKFRRMHLLLLQTTHTSSRRSRSFPAPLLLKHAFETSAQHGFHSGRQLPTRHFVNLLSCFEQAMTRKKAPKWRLVTPGLTVGLVSDLRVFTDQTAQNNLLALAMSASGRPEPHRPQQRPLARRTNSSRSAHSGGFLR
jgi:hypothetical protein